MRFLFPCLLLLMIGPLHGAEVYRWVDEDGTVHYSGTPRPGAEKVRLPEPNVFDPPSVDSPASEPAQPEPQRFQYESLEITQPEPQASIWDNQGNFSMSVSVTPPLAAARGHRIQFLLDGEVRGTASQSAWQFTGVHRGTHEVQAAIVDARGRTLIKTDPVTVHLHQQSVNHPARQ